MRNPSIRSGELLLRIAAGVATILAAKSLTLKIPLKMAVGSPTGALIAVGTATLLRFLIEKNVPVEDGSVVGSTTDGTVKVPVVGKERMKIFMKTFAKSNQETLILTLRTLISKSKIDAFIFGARLMAVGVSAWRSSKLKTSLE